MLKKETKCWLYAYTSVIYEIKKKIINIRSNITIKYVKKEYLFCFLVSSLYLNLSISISSIFISIFNLSFILLQSGRDYFIGRVRIKWYIII